MKYAPIKLYIALLFCSLNNFIKGSTYWDFTQDRPLNGLPPLPEQIYHPLFNPLPAWRTEKPNMGTQIRRPLINRTGKVRRPYEASEKRRRSCAVCKRIPIGY